MYATSSARCQVHAASRPPFANPNPNAQARRQTADGRPPFVLPLADCSLDHEARLTLTLILALALALTLTHPPTRRVPSMERAWETGWRGTVTLALTLALALTLSLTLFLTPTLTLTLTLIRPLECGAALVRRVRDAR